jgi:hypothetical protein
MCRSVGVKADCKPFVAGSGRNAAQTEVVRLAPGPAWPADVSWPAGEHTIPISQPLSPTDVMADGVALIAISCCTGKAFELVRRREGGFLTAFDLEAWRRQMIAETYRPEHTLPLSARLPFHYHRLPGFARNAMAGLLLALTRPRAGGFPAQLRDCGPLLISLLVDANSAVRETPVAVLTHDIDTGSGQRWIKAIADAERVVGARSCWNIVPRHYRIDDVQLEWLADAGHEIGLHGIWHTNREAFLQRDQLRSELDSIADLRGRFAISTYRGPSWYRTSAMFDVIADYFNTDMTTLDVDLVCPAGPGGVGVARPFHIRPKLVEIPCTLPFEAPLVVGVRPQSLAEFWRPKVELLRRAGGLVVVNTHPDPNYLGNAAILAEYKALLALLAAEGWSYKLPREIAVR